MPATVNAISPNMAHNDAATAVTIEGGPFRPAFHFDTSAGAASTEVGAFSVTLAPTTSADAAGQVSVQLADVRWVSPTTLAATVPAGVAGGTYDVTVIDPRGGRTTRTGGFTSLGPDQQSPIVTITRPEPRSIIGAGAGVAVSVTADDDLGFLARVSATVSPEGVSPLIECEPPAQTGRWICAFEFTAPMPAGDADLIAIDATAVDIAGHSTTATSTFRLAPRPSLTYLSPAIGPTSGGTALEVRGSNFVVPTRESDGSVLLIDGQPVETHVVDANTIVATTAPHDGGPAWVTVSTGGAQSGRMFFDFVDRPVLRGITPMRGPVTGGTKVIIVGNNFRGLHTEIFFGARRMDTKCVVGPNRIEGLTPAGEAPGPVTVRVTDRNGGSDEAVGAFTYDAVEGEAPPPDGAPNCGGPP
jgi:hypothetical protein